MFDDILDKLNIPAEQRPQVKKWAGIGAAFVGAILVGAF